MNSLPKKPSTATSRSGSRAIELIHVHAVAFIAGGVVMVLEILGTRVIGPVFGVTLFVWAALLSVTLGALAAGYFTGGVLVDRYPSVRMLGHILLAASLLTVLGSAVSTPILRASLAVGPRLGPMLSAAVLFGPALAALGMVAPILIRLSAYDLSVTGHRVGSISAASTLGSLASTSATAFFFIPNFDTRSTLLAAAALLMVTGAVTLIRHRALLAGSSLLFVAGSFAHTSVEVPASYSILAQSHSAYGLVQVIDDSERQVRFLRSDHSIIGAAYIQDPTESPFEYIDILGSVRCWRPNARHVLQIGLGSGTLATILRSHGLAVDVVEIDPNVVRFAEAHFGFTHADQVSVADARTWLQTARATYDIIIHDTFTGGSTPEHLLSVEALARMRLLLRPGGLLALNLVGFPAGSEAGATWAIARTLQAVFPEVQIYRDQSVGEAVTNVIFFASEKDREAPSRGAVATVPECPQMLERYASWRVTARVPEGPIISDSWNPVSQLALSTADEHFAAMNELLPSDVWLNTDKP